MIPPNASCVLAIRSEKCLCLSLQVLVEYNMTGCLVSNALRFTFGFLGGVFRCALFIREGSQWLLQGSDIDPPPRMSCGAITLMTLCPSLILASTGRKFVVEFKRRRLCCCVCATALGLYPPSAGRVFCTAWCQFPPIWGECVFALRACSLAYLRSLHVSH